MENFETCVLMCTSSYKKLKNKQVLRNKLWVCMFNKCKNTFTT